MEYLTTSEAAGKWNILRRVTVYCDEGIITGAIRKGAMWLFPADAEKSQDGRRVRYMGAEKY